MDNTVSEYEIWVYVSVLSEKNLDNRAGFFPFRPSAIITCKLSVLKSPLLYSGLKQIHFRALL